jgi:CheY-like chemotaxis protein
LNICLNNPGRDRSIASHTDPAFMTHAVEKTFAPPGSRHSVGCFVGTVQLWVENGLLKAWKTRGGHRRVLRDSVSRLLQPSAQSLSPLAPAAQPPAQPEAAPAERRLRILVLEEDRLLLRRYQSTLANWPMALEVSGADSAIEALIGLGREAPDLLLMSLRMTGVDGFAMARALRSSPHLPTLELVVLTELDPAQIESRGGLRPQAAWFCPRRFHSSALLLAHAWRIAERKG